MKYFMHEQLVEQPWGYSMILRKFMPGPVEMPTCHKWKIEVQGNGNTELEARDNAYEALQWLVGATMLNK